MVARRAARGHDRVGTGGNDAIAAAAAARAGATTAGSRTRSISTRGSIAAARAAWRRGVTDAKTPNSDA